MVTAANCRRQVKIGDGLLIQSVMIGINDHLYGINSRV